MVSITEISTPLVNIRFLLQTHKKDGTLLFKLNDYTCGVLFIFFRIIFYPILTWRMIYGMKFLPVTSHNVLMLLLGKYRIDQTCLKLVLCGTLGWNVHNLINLDHCDAKDSFIIFRRAKRERK